MTKKRVTLQDIADYFEVTRVSVSKAINNQPGVSEELRRKILNFAFEAGYIKANGQNVTKTNSFAFIIQHRFYMENDNFYSAIFNNLNTLCQSKGKRLQLFVVEHEAIDNSILNQINRNSVDGIFIGGEICEKILHMLTNLGLPLVYIDFHNHRINNDSVLVDNFNISYIATNYLIDRGHTEIGFVGNSLINVMDRYYGYRKALNAANLQFREEWLLSNYNEQTGYYTLDLVLPRKLPTAFVCHCDMSAYFLIHKLALTGLKVPDHISIISFDNTLLAETCSPPLTSVNISKKEFAVSAYSMMNSRILHPKNEAKQTLINTKIIERDSVKNISNIPTNH